MKHLYWFLNLTFSQRHKTNKNNKKTFHYSLHTRMFLFHYEKENKTLFKNILLRVLTYLKPKSLVISRACPSVCNS